MRIAPLLALAALAACTHNTIPGTNVPDEPQNRAVLQVSSTRGTPAARAIRTTWRDCASRFRATSAGCAP